MWFAIRLTAISVVLYWTAKHVSNIMKLDQNDVGSSFNRCILWHSVASIRQSEWDRAVIKLLFWISDRRHWYTTYVYILYTWGWRAPWRIQVLLFRGTPASWRQANPYMASIRLQQPVASAATVLRWVSRLVRGTNEHALLNFRLFAEWTVSKQALVSNYISAQISKAWGVAIDRAVS
jgi:hypothetical protein